MQRDMDLVRQIALELSAQPLGALLSGLDGVEQAKFVQHALWMEQGGLIVADFKWTMDRKPPHTFIKYLTWEGCDFLDAARDETLWKKAKEEFIRPAASWSFGLMKDWLVAEIRQGLPTLRG